MNEVTSENPVPDTIRVIQTFALAFQRGGLYETGYADPWRVSGATTATDTETMLRALAYVHGSADMARLACPYQGRSWRIAHLIGCAAGMLGIALENGDTREKVARQIDSVTRELLGLIADDKLGV